ncbi:MAG: hypothetical protein J6Y02_12565 [Pseudobutyrivibrio sp.]|nr:hypothetical protein [Pseudobutyrivibrio sp.]
MKNFMKNLALIVVVAVMSSAGTVGYMMYNYGMVNVSGHTDHYEVRCNGEVIDSYDEDVTDKVSYNVTINESYELFSR